MTTYTNRRIDFADKGCKAITKNYISLSYFNPFRYFRVKQ